MSAVKKNALLKVVAEDKEKHYIRAEGPSGFPAVITYCAFLYIIIPEINKNTSEWNR